MMLPPLQSVTAVLLDAIRMTRDARDALARGDAGLAVSALVGAGSWVGLAHAWAAQSADWALQMRRIKRTRAHVDRIVREVMAVVDGRCAVVVVGRPSEARKETN